MGFLMSPSPALTVMASMNWSLQECVPTTKARFVFLISLSTVLCCGNKDAQQLNWLLAGKSGLAVHCGLTDPSQTVEVPQVRSYQSDEAMTGVGPTFSLNRLTQNSPQPASLSPLTPEWAASFLASASPETALLLPSPARCFLLLPAGLPCLHSFTFVYQQLSPLALVGFSHTLLHSMPFPCTCSHPQPPQFCFPWLLFSATQLSPPRGHWDKY